MKKLLPVILIALFSCKKNEVPKDPDEIHYKETVVLNDVPRATLTLENVYDGRCPKGVNCFMAGSASVDLLLKGFTTQGEISKIVKMDLGGNVIISETPPKYVKVDTIAQNFAGIDYYFILKNIKPSNPELGDSQNKEKYSIILKIIKK